MRQAVVVLFAVLAAIGVQAKPSLPDWAAAVTALPIPSGAAGKKAVVLLDDKHVEVEPSGEVIIRTRRAIRVLNSDGIRLGTIVAFSDNDTKLRALNAWVVGDSGRVVAYRQSDAIETAAFGYELYADARAKILALPVQPGGIAVWEIEQRDRAPLMQVSWSFQTDVPVAKAHLDVVVPTGWSIDSHWTRHHPVPPLKSDNTYSWDLNDVPAIADEPAMPPLESVASRLDINILRHANSPRRSWDDIGRWYSDLAAPSVHATAPALQARARQLVANVSDWPAKVRALARFAQQDVRYVAIEIGIGGYKPHAASDIFAQRFGDCKDKVTVMRAMFREVGIESHYVLVNATSGVVADFPTVTAFNHAIIAIEVPADASVAGLHAIVEHERYGRLLLFDPTSEVTPLGYLPLNLQGERGLLVEAEGGELITMPAAPPEANRCRRAAKLRLVDGLLTGDVVETRSGSAADFVRYALRPLHGVERRHWIERLVTPAAADVSIGGITVEGADDPYADLTIRYTISSRSALTDVGGMVLLRPSSLRSAGEELVDADRRVHPYLTSGAGTRSDEVEIAVPDSYAIDELPKPVTIVSPFATYSSRFDGGERVLRYVRRYEIKARTVAAASVAEFMSVLGRIRADDRNAVVLKQR